MGKELFFSFSSPSELFRPQKSGERKGDASTVGSDGPQTLAEVQELMQKWGMIEADKHVLKRFSYCLESLTGGTSSSTLSGEDKALAGKDHSSKECSPLNHHSTISVDASSMSSQQHFHEGLANDFLHCLFHSPTIQKECPEMFTTMRKERKHSFCRDCGGSAGAVHFRPLSCTWTSLEPLEAPLLSHKVIRRSVDRTYPPEGSTHRKECSNTIAEASGRESTSEQDASPHTRDDDHRRQHLSSERTSTLVQKEFPMPIVKRPEKCLGGDVIVSDELRALLLDTFHLRQEGEGPSEDDDDEEEEDFDYYHHGSSLSRYERQKIYSREDRQAFLFHILWRIVVGGGFSNQFEDDFIVYKGAVRTLFRSMVRSIRASRVEESFSSAEQKTESQNDKAAGAVQPPTHRFLPRIHSLVFQVMDYVRGGGSAVYEDGPAEGLWWEQQDSVMAPHLNYCYVIVNPLQQEVVLWYHRM